MDFIGPVLMNILPVAVDERIEAGGIVDGSTGTGVRGLQTNVADPVMRGMFSGIPGKIMSPENDGVDP